MVEARREAKKSAVERSETAPAGRSPAPPERSEGPAGERSEPALAGEAGQPRREARARNAGNALGHRRAHGAERSCAAVYSERQLAGSAHRFLVQPLQRRRRARAATRFMLTEYERDAIRPHVLGKFRDLLEATAKSPAMLFYLDNWMSADPDGAAMAHEAARRAAGRGRVGGRRRRCRRAAATRRRSKSTPDGLNENYGRELMELHTLGVDGGYTQKDVTEVARAFTGWTIDSPRQGGGFTLRPAPARRRARRSCSATRSRRAAASRDGEQVLDILATHPSTARFIATKLARRFVSDDAAAGARRSRRRAVPRDRRRSARGDADDPHVAGVPRARGVPREGEDAVRVRRQRAARDRRRRAATRGRSCARCSSSGMPLYSASRRPATRTRRTRG